MVVPGSGHRIAQPLGSLSPRQANTQDTAFPSRQRVRTAGMAFGLLPSPSSSAIDTTASHNTRSNHGRVTTVGVSGVPGPSQRGRRVRLAPHERVLRPGDQRPDVGTDAANVL